MVESNVETVAVMVGLRPISTFLSSFPSLCLYPTTVAPRSPSRPIAAVETQVCSSPNLPFSLPLPLCACVCHGHGSGSSQRFRVRIELVILSPASEFNGGGGEDEVGQAGAEPGIFVWRAKCDTNTFIKITSTHIYIHICALFYYIYTLFIW